MIEEEFRSGSKLDERWEALMGVSPLLFPSPPGYFAVKAQIDAEKAREELQIQMKGEQNEHSRVPGLW